VASKSRDSLHSIDSTIVKAQRAPSGVQWGGVARKRYRPRPSFDETRYSGDGRGRPLNFVVTGGKVHDSQAARRFWRHQGQHRQARQIKPVTARTSGKPSVTTVWYRSSLAEATRPKRPGPQTEFTDGGLMSKTSFARLKTGDASSPALTNWPVIPGARSDRRGGFLDQVLRLSLVVQLNLARCEPLVRSRCIALSAMSTSTAKVSGAWSSLFRSLPHKVDGAIDFPPFGGNERCR
jgi:hypothetical protein